MRRILFKRPPHPLDRVEPPKRTRGDDDDHSALLSAYLHDLDAEREWWNHHELPPISYHEDFNSVYLNVQSKICS